MGTKRPAGEIDQSQHRPRRDKAKRTRLSPIENENSSDPSSCSVSVDSALQSSPPASEHTRQSSLSSLHVEDQEDDSEESISSSTSSDTSDNESDVDIITIGGPKKPDMLSSIFSDEAADDLRTRLNTLLPELALANDLLLSRGKAKNMEDVEEGEQHIEMNLGLGVLEEKGEDGHERSSSSEDSSESEDEGGVEEDVPASSGAVKRVRENGGAGAMSELLGKKNGRRKVGIEDLG